MTTQRYINYVLNYTHIVKNYIGEHSLDSHTIALTLNQVSTAALLAIDRINKNDIKDYNQLIEACSPIGDAFFDQLVNDKDYTDYMNEMSLRQKEEHELPY